MICSGPHTYWEEARLGGRSRETFSQWSGLFWAWYNLSSKGRWWVSLAMSWVGKRFKHLTPFGVVILVVSRKGLFFFSTIRQEYYGRPLASCGLEISWLRPDGKYLKKAYLRNALRSVGGLELSALITDSKKKNHWSFIPLDQINPPLNVTAEIKGTRLSIQWEKPVSAFPIHCFDYEVKIHNARNGYLQVITQIIPIFDDRHLF